MAKALHLFSKPHLCHHCIVHRHRDSKVSGDKSKIDEKFKPDDIGDLDR
jgi:hypothetical protein